MLFSPDKTSFFNSSLSDSRIFLPFEYVSVETLAVLANFFVVLIGIIGFSDF